MGEPNLQPAISPHPPAVLFADVCGWVDLCARKGDSVALGLRDALFGPLRDIIQANHGSVVQTIGDELMCLFDSATDAARAACEMQRYASYANRTTSEPLSLRMGIHAGAVVRSAMDVVGTTVNIAARIAASSSPERILIAHSAAELLTAPELSKQLRPWRNEPLKGLEDSLVVMELLWRERPSQTTVAVLSQRSVTPQHHPRLTLRCQGQVRVLESGGKPLTFGRSEHNDLVISDLQRCVSGSHGKIEMRGGSIVLTDNSRNGIYIAFGTDKFYVVQNTVVLHTSGRMALGQSPYESDAIFAEFEIQ